MQKSNNTKTPIISILWDASPLWGHLVLNAVIQTGLSYSVIRSEDCIRNGIKSKILIVPGGSGRIKASKLGEEGIYAIQEFTKKGGIYIGFCGGAGLALKDGLNICPWGRSFYKDRMQHLVSGHILSSIIQDRLIPNSFDDDFCPNKTIHSNDNNTCNSNIHSTDTNSHNDDANAKNIINAENNTSANNNRNSLYTEVPLPVWWPGKFEEPKKEINLNEHQSAVRVLARYKAMGNDLHVADIPIQKLPSSALEDWYNLYGIVLRPSLLDGQPAVINGNYGKGEYILSYCHLETPDSPFANAIFAHILRTCLENHDPNFSDETSQAFEINNTGLAKNILNTEKYCPTWIDSEIQNTWAILQELYDGLEELFKLGVDLHLLFPRTPWLYGWHTSVPGSHLNALRVALLRSLLLPTNKRREHYMMTKGVSFAENMIVFVSGAKSWLLAKRLSETITETDVIPTHILHAQKQELFGLHMSGGGLCGLLIDWLDEFLFLQ